MLADEQFANLGFSLRANASSRTRPRVAQTRRHTRRATGQQVFCERGAGSTNVARFINASKWTKNWLIFFMIQLPWTLIFQSIIGIFVRCRSFQLCVVLFSRCSRHFLLIQPWVQWRSQTHFIVFYANTSQWTYDYCCISVGEWWTRTIELNDVAIQDLEFLIFQIHGWPPGTICNV